MGPKTLICDFVAQSDFWAWETDCALRGVYISSNFTELTGRPREDFLGVPRLDLLARFLGEDDLAAHRADLMARRPFRAFRYPVRRPDSEAKWLESSGTPVFDKDGAFRGYRGVTRFVTSDVEHSQRLAQAHRDMRINETVFGHVERVARIGAWKLDLRSGTLDWSAEIFNIFELPRDTPVTVELALEPFPVEARGELQAALEQAVKTGEPFDLILPFVTAKGNFRWVRALGEADRAAGRSVGLFGTFQDATEERNRQDEFRRLAETDHLTGIHNRAAFQNLAAQAIAEAADEGMFGALCLIDLDRFKQINDHYGHAAGDAVLRDTTVWLQSLIAGEADARVARLGGDEFALILTGYGSAGALDESLQRRFHGLHRRIHHCERVIDVGVSVGYAVFPDHGGGLDELMANADLALYDAKSRGRRRLSKYRQSFGSAFSRKMDLIGEFRAALADDAIVPYYQPIVELATRRVSGFEALARWNHPTRGVITAGAFADVFENQEIVADIGDVMMEAITADMGRWKAQGLVFGRVGFNITDANLLEPGFALTLSALLARHRLLPRQMVIEVTENTIFKSQHPILDSLAKLKEMGITIALDDFGTGFSSLTHLQDIPFDILKVDKSFAGNVDSSPASRAIVQSLVGLGEALGYTTVAEGIETEEDLESLKALGCQRGQGYLFARPMPAADVPAFLGSTETTEAAQRLAAVAAG